VLGFGVGCIVGGLTGTIIIPLDMGFMSIIMPLSSRVFNPFSPCITTDSLGVGETPERMKAGLTMRESRSFGEKIMVTIGKLVPVTKGAQKRNE
jgi:hypothetical protein